MSNVRVAMPQPQTLQRTRAKVAKAIGFGRGHTPKVDANLEHLKALADSKGMGVDLSAMPSDEAIQLLLKR